MSNAQNAVRSAFTYILLIPLALLVGYFLATSGIGAYVDVTSLFPILALFGLLSLPFLLKWHQPLLLLTLNTSAVVFFLPGGLPFWFPMAALSLTLALAQRALDREMKFVYAPSVVWPVICLTAVIFLVGYLTGGFGVRIFGSEQYGGKRYMYIFVAIAAFFALIAKPIPREKALLFVGLYFLGSIANTMSNIIPLMPREFYWLALIFPVSGNDMGSVGSTVTSEAIGRFYGLTTTGYCVFYYLLARYGISQMLSGRTAWRFVLLLSVWVLSMWGGFRSALLLTGITFLLVFFYEGLFRTKYALIFAGILVLGSLALIPLASSLPLSVQRTLTILPLNLNPIARYEAEASSQWRLEMWSLVLPEVPQYLLTPKGLGMNGVEVDLTGELVTRGLARTEDLSMLAGDYHNGPLSVLIPFGIYGFLAWLWFLAASIRALWLNYKYGDESLRKINTLLLACFLTNTIMFFFVFGGFFGEVITFVGLVGLSISLNNGICSRDAKTAAAEVQEPESDLVGFEPALEARRG